MSLDNISEAVVKGNAKDVAKLVQEAIDGKIPAQDILNKGLLKGMSIIGQKFQDGEVFVPEVLIGARALNKGTEILKPKLVAEGVKPIGKAVGGTIKGDLHDIGKNLVKLMMEGVGFEVIDLGFDVSAEQIIAAVKENQPQIVFMSAMLTTTMPYFSVVVEALKSAGLRDKLKIMIGGSPVTPGFCAEIGADGTTEDASSAAEMAKKFVS